MDILDKPEVFDPAQASIKELAEKAEEDDDSELQYLLGKRHAEDLPPNSTGAAKWFGRAAKHGHKKAQVNIAKMHAQSMGGSKADNAVRYLMTQYQWSQVDAVTAITGKPPPAVVPVGAAGNGWGGQQQPPPQQ